MGTSVIYSDSLTILPPPTKDMNLLLQVRSGLLLFLLRDTTIAQVGQA